MISIIAGGLIALMIGFGLVWYVGIKPGIENKKVVRDFYKEK